MASNNRKKPDGSRPEGDGQAAGRSSNAVIEALYWIVVQGSEARVVKGDEKPSSVASEGERSIEIEGPYPSEETANARLDRLTTGRHQRRTSILARGDAA